MLHRYHKVLSSAVAPTLPTRNCKSCSHWKSLNIYQQKISRDTNITGEVCVTEATLSLSLWFRPLERTCPPFPCGFDLGRDKNLKQIPAAQSQCWDILSNPSSHLNHSKGVRKKALHLCQGTLITRAESKACSQLFHKTNDCTALS